MTIIQLLLVMTILWADNTALTTNITHAGAYNYYAVAPVTQRYLHRLWLRHDNSYVSATPRPTGVYGPPEGVRPRPGAGQSQH